MTPVVFDECFGWLHTGPHRRGGDVACLICPALQRDAYDSHFGIRLLADALAMRGYPTLRFDYPGIGDSLEPGEADAWAAWQRSVDGAADRLREATGATRIVLAGLRIGATLAALAAERRTDVAGLILLDPVLRGQSYLRQLGIEARLQDLPVAAGRLDFHELHLDPDAFAAVSRTDLRAARLQAGLPVAAFVQSGSKSLARCVDAWTRSGAAVTVGDFAGLSPLLIHNMVAECPRPDFSAVLGWLESKLPAAPLPLPYPLAQASLLPPGCVETPLQFGEDGRLFGMLCRPATTSATAGTGDLVVVIGNAGRDPHYGFGRFTVEFARRLAAIGIASLRMDFAGVGDSAGRADVASHVFETDHGPDISAALDTLEALGYRRFAFEGLCSGGYHGLHASLADPRVCVLVLLNLPLFDWQPGGAINFRTYSTGAPTRFVHRLRDRRFWRRMFRGKVRVDRFIAGQVFRLWGHTWAIRRRIGRGIGLPIPLTSAEHTLATLEERRVRTLFLFGPQDHGFDAFQQEFGRGGKGLAAFTHAELEVVPGLDHFLSRRAIRDRVIERMAHFIREAAQAAGATSSAATADARSEEC